MNSDKKANDDRGSLRPAVQESDILRNTFAYDFAPRAGVPTFAGKGGGGGECPVFLASPWKGTFVVYYVRPWVLIGRCVLLVGRVRGWICRCERDY